MKRRFPCFAVTAGMALTASATDIPLPGINLGATSFEDGGGGVGTLLQWSASRFDADRTYGADGRRVSLPYEKTLTVQRLHYAYTTGVTWLGGYLGGEVLVPLTHLDVYAGATRTNGSGMGNPNLGIYLQWLNKAWLGRRFDSRLSLTVSVPWGDYHSDARFNAGNGYTSFNPYYAFTLHLTPKWEFSGRLLYLWNSVNHHPETRYRAHTVRPGQALHYNLSLSYAVTPQWRVGGAMYHLQQLSADQIDGRAQPSSKERVFGLGPGVQWRKRQHRVISNLYMESLARNRAAGTEWVLRYMYVY